MSELEPITKGLQGWKTRQIEIAILDRMGKSTTPQTGWHMYQKLRKTYPLDGYQFCARMISLSEKGFLTIVGTDYDCGHEFVLTEQYNKKPNAE